MKKISSACVLFSLLLVSAPAFASFSCFCVGQNRAAGTCGNGGVSGGFQDVRKNLPDNLMRFLLLTQALRDTLASSGKAYDPKSGWSCWKE